MARQRWRRGVESGILSFMGFAVVFKRLLFSVATCLVCSVPLAAQERLAYVVGNGAGTPSDDALAVSRALLGLGFDVIRRQDVTPDTLPLGNRAARTVVLYFSGMTSVDDDDMMLMARGGKGWPMVDTAENFLASGAQQVLIFVQTCHSDSAAVAEMESDEDTSELAGVYFALSANPAEGCISHDKTRFTDRVLAALSTPDMGIAEAFDAADGAGFAASYLVEPLVLWESADKDVSLSAQDMAVLDRLAPADRDRMRALWESAGLMGEASNTEPAINVVRNETVVLTGTVAAVDMGAVIAPAQVTAVEQVSFTPATTPTTSSGVQIFNTAPRSQVQALPTAQGLPRPSVIVGRIETDEPSGTATQTGALTGTALDGSGFEARQTIRNQDAELYAQLVGSGAFDPAANQLAVALQTELKRMGCYTGGIDGDWGRGSQGSVDRYFQQIGETATTRDATIELFRKIALKDDVECPRVVQARAAQPRATTRTNTTRTTTRATTTRRQTTTAPKAAAKPSGSGKINTNRLGTGVFR